MTFRHWVAIACILAFTATVAEAQQQKTIGDPAEYYAYIAALKIGDPAQKAAALESFVASYPNSVVKEDALEQAVAAYQQANNVTAVEKTASRITQIDKGNVRALAMLTYIERTKVTRGDKAALADMQAHAQQGLSALTDLPKPDGLSDPEFAQLRAQMTEIFNGALGFAAIQNKDYAKARDAYLKVIKANPNNMQDVYQLGIAELEMSPLDAVGFWYIARAIALSKVQNLANSVPQIDAYGRAKYKRYHGSEDGWDAIVAQASQGTEVPANFARSIKAAPTPAEIAVNAVRDNDPMSLSYSDYEYVLGYRDASPANKDAADKVWQTIQAIQKNGTIKIKIPVKVISASATSLDVAISDDHQSANTVDMRVTLGAVPSQLPAPGAMISIVGVISDYTPKPFLFLMKEAEVAARQ